MQKHLIIFIKNPVLGTVKTRLAKTVGDKAALSIYQDLLEKCKVESSAVAAKRHLFYSQEVLEGDIWSSEKFEKKLQAEGDLGRKITAAFKTVFQEAGKTLIIGSDCYDLTAEIIEEAFQRLDKVDVVIGPANDGGYYLLGINQYHPSLFNDVNWSTETVLHETISKAKKEGLSIALLRELVDLDTIEDLENSGYKHKALYANDGKD